MAPLENERFKVLDVENHQKRKEILIEDKETDKHYVVTRTIDPMGRYMYKAQDLSELPDIRAVDEWNHRKYRGVNIDQLMSTQQMSDTSNKLENDRYMIVDTYQTEYSSRKTLIKDKTNDKLTDYRTRADSEHGWDAASKTTLDKWNEQKYEGVSVALMEIHVLRHIEEQQKAKENKRHASLNKQLHASLNKQLVEARPNVGNTYASDKQKSTDNHSYDNGR